MDTCYVLAHGAGAGMAHPFMASIAEGLAERGVATPRYHVPARAGRKDADVRVEMLGAGGLDGQIASLPHSHPQSWAYVPHAHPVVASTA